MAIASDLTKAWKAAFPMRTALALWGSCSPKPPGKAKAAEKVTVAMSAATTKCNSSALWALVTNPLSHYPSTRIRPLRYGPPPTIFHNSLDILHLIRLARNFTHRKTNNHSSGPHWN